MHQPWLFSFDSASPFFLLLVSLPHGPLHPAVPKVRGVYYVGIENNTRIGCVIPL